MACLDVTRTSVQVEFRPLSVGCSGGELPSSDTDISQVEGYQIQYNVGRAIISVWVQVGINLDKFCCNEGISVSRGGITNSIISANRRDVIVTVSGLDFNTPDSLICDYMRKFGGIIISARKVQW